MKGKLIESWKKGNKQVSLFVNKIPKSERLYFTINITSGYFDKKANCWFNPAINIKVTDVEFYKYGMDKAVEKSFDIINKNQKIFSKATNKEEIAKRELENSKKPNL